MYKNDQFQCSSASRKFLNRYARCAGRDRDAPFQCSSASRKFLNPGVSIDIEGFALLFQCSSASRKFLNLGEETLKTLLLGGFSALQRAENSSIREQREAQERARAEVSVLFSEPKIPQSARASARSSAAMRVSVLFSEPKIPQSENDFRVSRASGGFSALQRAENSSIPDRSSSPICRTTRVSVLFSEPKIPQSPRN